MSIIKAKKDIGIIKYLSKFLPIKTFDQMYKALIRSHLDYCDTIYHIPASNSQINLGVTLNSLMVKEERTQYQAAPAITGTWQGTNRSKLYEEKNWDGRHFLTVVGADAFSRYTKLKSTRPLLILDINYLHTVDPCIDLIILIPFKK